MKRNLTQEELAGRVHLTRTSITNIEKGRQKLLLHTFIAVASELGVSPAELLAPTDANATVTVEENLPSNLSPSVKSWILSGVSTARTQPKT